MKIGEFSKLSSSDKKLWMLRTEASQRAVRAAKSSLALADISRMFIGIPSVIPNIFQKETFLLRRRRENPPVGWAWGTFHGKMR